MSAFYVGQRVKKVRGTHAIGATGVVLEVGRSPAPGFTVFVRVDKRQVGVDGRTGKAVVCDQGWCRPDDLEPILPEGAAPSEFTTLADLLTSLNVEVPA